jgi:hypothetical protein
MLMGEASRSVTVSPSVIPAICPSSSAPKVGNDIRRIDRILST